MDLMSFSIITRYNVRAGFTGNRNVNSKVWLPSRRPLFTDYCAASIHAQTDQRFNWYVLVDTELPAEEEEWIASTGKCKVIRCESQSHGIDLIRREVSNGYSLALTTRLDSDDSLAPNFVASMREQALRGAASALTGSNGLVVCFANGVEHDTIADTWFDRYYPNNAFIGLLEPLTRPARMILQHAHYDMCRHYDSTTVLTDEPMWCIRVHGDNVANKVKGEARESAPAVFKP